MKNQFQRLFETLEPAEKRSFEVFLRSSYLSRNAELPAALLAETEGAFPPVAATEKQEVLADWATKSDVQRRLLRSELLARLEDFLSYEQSKGKSAFRRHLSLKKDLRKRQQSLRYRTQDRKSDKLLEAFGDGPRRSRLAYELAAERLAVRLQERKLTTADLQTVQQLHERNFLLESLRLACEGLSMRTASPQTHSSGLLAVLLHYLEGQEPFSEDLLLHTYSNCYLTLKDSEDDAAFYRLQEGLEKLSNIDPTEARDLILLAINACIRRINGNRPDGEHYAFQLYNLGLERGYLLDNGRLSRFTFNNIVALALKTGDQQRAEDFLDRYASLLPAAYAQSTEALNRARLAYERGELEEAMEYLRSAKDQEVLTTLNIRILQMRVYYALDEFRLLDAHLDALDIYLRRRKEALGYRYGMYRNLVNYVRRFRRLNPYDRAALKKYRDELQKEEQLPERNWLRSISKAND